MPLTVPQLRKWFAFAAIAIVVMVAGFYFYARIRIRRALDEVPQRLGVNIQQSTEGFSLSKSEGGRTIFTVRASRAVQFKQGGRAELQDVNIVVYGRRANRFDQIYGSSFEYDPQSGNISARGEVHIDLEGNAEGPVRPDQTTPQELKNPIHLKTSGLVFNQKTGLANTDQPVEFRFPQASGTAVGASYDSKSNLFTLKSNVHVVTSAPTPESITARRAMVTKEPRQAVLEGVRMERGPQVVAANRVTASLRDDNTISHLLAAGDVNLQSKGSTRAQARAPQADIYLADKTEKNALRSAVLSGGVTFESSGAQNMSGQAGRVVMNFAAGSKLQKVRATENVRLSQKAAETRSSQDLDLTAQAMDFLVTNGKRLERAETSGAAQIAISEPAAANRAESRTLVTAGKFDAGFDQRSHLQTLHGAPDAKVVWSSPGRPDRTATSQQLTARFSEQGGIEGLVQQGSFHYVEPVAKTAANSPPGAAREAWAETARYSPADETLALSGSPRISEGGMTITAQSFRIDRRTGDAQGEGVVKTTYSELRQQAGAMLATSDPIHVTAKAVAFTSSARAARYSGGARLWQGANIVQAPVIEFNQDARTVVAQGATGTPKSAKPVTTVFVQQDKAGKVTPVTVTAARLTYTDSDRKAHFEGGVVVKGADATVMADQVDVFLQARAAVSGPSQLDRIVAQAHVTIEEPSRRATGEKLVYTAAESKFVLTGGPPSIFDAERGQVTGVSLTFYTHDDRVLVEGNNSARAVTRTRVTQ